MGEAAATVTLRLLGTSDLHGLVHGYDYHRARPNGAVGLGRIAGLVALARADAVNTLLFDNGDIIQGSPLGDYMARPDRLDARAGHPMIRAMNRLGFDAATVGNHEFNYGLGFLERVLGGACFPFVCANIDTVEAGGRAGGSWLRPWVVLERALRDEAGVSHRIRIGVIGFVTPQIMVWDKAHLDGRIVARDIVEAARRHLPALRARCDLVVALCHAGISGASYHPGEEDAALHLAAVPGIDAVLAGHAHRLLPGPDYEGVDGVDWCRGALHGVPAVMPGFWGSHLGIMDLTLARRNGSWRVEAFACAVWPARGTPGQPAPDEDPAVLAEAEPEHRATLDWMKQPVGRTTVPIHSYFSLLGNDAALTLVNDAQRWYAAPLLAGTEWAGLPLLSAASPFKAGGAGPGSFVDLPAGPLAMKDIASLYMFANTICVVRASGAILREWLERGCAIFNRIDPLDAEPQPLAAPDAASYLFDTIAGLSYEIDLSQPPRYDRLGRLIDRTAHRIASLRHQNRAVEDDADFLVVTNNYRADGGGGFPGTGARPVLQAPDLNRDVIVRYILAHDPVAPRAEPVWCFRPLHRPVQLAFDGTEATARHLDGRPGLRRLHGGSNGFVRYALTLG